MQVAVVPYRSSLIETEELLHVVAALQTQVVRDLGPIWGVSAIVAPFTRLEDVPPSYAPVVIVDEDALPTVHGSHFAMDGRPFAVVRYEPDGWALATSHELLELVCDPHGTRTVVGPSLLDEQRGAASEEAQGEVAYLVEVCDPCEHSTYVIGGVTVSDFVTPDFYSVGGGAGGRYSFSGRIQRPRQLLEGGYLSWRAGHPSTIWQARAGDASESEEESVPQEEPRAYATAELHIGRLPADSESSGAATSGAARLSRSWIDLQKTDRPSPSTARRYRPDPVAKQAAGEFKKQLDLFITLLTGPPPLGLDEVIAQLEELARIEDPEAARTRLAALGITAPEAIEDRWRLVIDALKEQQKVASLFGGDMMDQGFAGWLAMLRM